jgi:hypothetical protein
MKTRIIGVNLGEMHMLLLKKIEELTLYVIKLKNDRDNKRIHSRVSSAQYLSRK